jgi:acetyl/propionyl-CoA carboxylase alpha subunit
MNAEPRLTVVFENAGAAVPVTVSPGPLRLRTSANGTTGLFERTAFAPDGALWRIDRPGEPDALALVGADGVRLADRGDVFFYAFHRPDAGAEGAQAEDEARAPLPGRVIALAVAPGAVVARGDVLAVVEAMKMEHTVRASRAGVIADVLAAEGVQVKAGDVLVRLERLTEPA